MSNLGAAFEGRSPTGQTGNSTTHTRRKKKQGYQWWCLLAWRETWRLTIPRRRFDLQRPVDAGEAFAGSAVVVGTEVETWVDIAE